MFMQLDNQRLCTESLWGRGSATLECGVLRVFLFLWRGDPRSGLRVVGSTYHSTIVHIVGTYFADTTVACQEIRNRSVSISHAPSAY